MTDTALVAASRDVLSRHARSFRWAAAFLPPDRHDDAAVLYAFCRLADDLADEADSQQQADADLEQLERELTGEAPARPLVALYRDVVHRNGGDLEPARQLLIGLRSDLVPTLLVADDAQLDRYCYRVAGTVGLMMCGVLGVTHPQAAPFAVDLGIAMQLTNICRDVLEDTHRGRVYLPADRLRAVGETSERVLSGEADHAAVARVVLDLLDRADRYYASAWRGMAHIPFRTRIAIAVASTVYRAIGTRLRARGGNALAGRVWVPWWQKVGWVAVALGRVTASALRRPPTDHLPELHLALRDLPGCHV